MPNPFEDSTSLFPDITDAVDEAYDENAAKGAVTDAETGPDLADISEQDAKGNEDVKNIGFGLDHIVDPEVNKEFKEAFTQTVELFSRIHLKPPTPAEFEMVGVDFELLAEKYKQMTANGITPSIIVSPVLPFKWDGKQGIGHDWESLYNVLTTNRTINNNPLMRNDKGVHGLNVHTDILGDQPEIYNQEIEGIVGSEKAHYAIMGSDMIHWRIMLMLPNSETEKVYKSQPDLESTDTPEGYITPSVSEYLTLQAMRIQSGKGVSKNDNYSDRLRGYIVSGSDSLQPFRLSGYWQPNENKGLIHIAKDNPGLSGILISAFG